MNTLLKTHADAIIKASIEAVLPDNAVRRALENKDFPGKVVLVAAGKAAWQMAHTASLVLVADQPGRGDHQVPPCDGKYRKYHLPGSGASRTR